MKLDEKNLNRLFWGILVISAPVFLLRLFIYWSEIEPSSGFFVGKGIPCLIYNIIGFLVFALCLFFAWRKVGGKVGVKEKKVSRDPKASRNEEEFFFQDDEVSPAESEPREENTLDDYVEKIATWQGTLSAFSCFLPGFGFLAYALSFATEKGLFSDPYRLIFSILSALSGAYFLFAAAGNSSKKSIFRAFFSLVPALWCTVRMVVEYRDLTRFVNKSLYIGQFLFIISALIFFLYQSQLLLKEKALFDPNALAFSALPAIFFGITSRLPQLFAVVMDRISMDLVDASSLLIDLAITLFVWIKIRQILE